MQYEDWEDAKQRIVSRYKFVKMHVIVDADEKRIVSCEVTSGTAHDSPIFKQMFAVVSDGTGCVMLDAGYDAIRNYRMIRDAGRKLMICTRKNHVARNVRLVGKNFSSAASRSRGGSARLRSRQAATLAQARAWAGWQLPPAPSCQNE